MKRNFVAVIIILFSLFIFSSTLKAGTSFDKLNIIYIGNSITIAHGLEKSPSDVAAEQLIGLGYTVKYVNCGVSGSTTVDFLPETGTLFQNVINAAGSLDGENALLVFSIMLGTNDSAVQGPNGAPVSAVQYKQNLEKIINGLRKRYPECKIVLNRPLWYSTNTHNSSTYLQEGLGRLQTYFPQIKALVDENSDYVFEGDTEAYTFFENNHLQYFQAEQGNSGVFYLHPNQQGAEKLAGYWVGGMKKHLHGWNVKKKVVRQKATGKKKVACIGNSITENVGLPEKDKYPAVLQRLLGTENYEVRNFGVSARTMLTKGDYPYINEAKYREALNWQPDIVIIKLGTNDAKPYNWVHRAEYTQDYLNFISSFEALASDPDIYVCYPLPAFPNNWIDIKEETFTIEMMPMIHDVASRKGATVIDLHTPFLGKEALTYDLVHPNFRGTSYMAHIIGSVICPDCNIALPEDFFVRVADFDFTDKAEEFTASVASSGLDKLINNDPLDGIKEPFSADMWFAVKLPSNTRITGYSLTTPKTETANTPKSWVLQGSLNATVWVDIDTRSNVEFKPLETQIFEIPFSKVGDLPLYRNYRLLIKENHGGSYLELNEWQLLGFEATFGSDVTNNGGSITGQHTGYPGELIGNLIDKNRDTKYCVVDKGPGWVQYESPEEVKINRYKITSCKDLFDRNPKSWRLLGSATGVEWDVLDERTNQDFIAKFHTVEFPLHKDKAYKYFRLDITEIYTGQTFQFAEWQLFEGAPVTRQEDAKINSNVYSREGHVYIQTEESISYEVFNSLGHKVIDGIIGAGETAGRFVGASGAYFIKLSSTAGTKVIKIII